MRASQIVATASVALLALGALPRASAAPVALRNADENPVARRLAGTWVLDRAMNERRHAIVQMCDTIDFVSDPQVASRIPACHDAALAQHAAYLSGTMRMHLADSGGVVHEFPFLLIERGGCPVIVFFMHGDGGPMGRAESFYLMLAAAHDPSGDLLFVGSNNPGGATVAFMRAPETGGGPR